MKLLVLLVRGFLFEREMFLSRCVKNSECREKHYIHVMNELIFVNYYSFVFYLLFNLSLAIVNTDVKKHIIQIIPHYTD